MEFAGVWRRAE